ncbi:type 4 pilus major pilin [Ralstonia pseudosolanacearum]|uniref:Type 4 secretion system PilS N-terminal domain-containing protein n=1 Tax=Ralstonia solanacearum TaxID=305 RepID=A0ABY6NFT0_RALSL|nr:hypothetical protein LH706_06735 [Ralstonia solanacearum]
MKLFAINKKKAARGFTLIEILLVVGFIALAGIGIYVVYNKVQTGNAANTEARNLDTLRAGVKNLYGASVNYGTVSETVLLQGRVVPDSMRDAAGTAIINSFGGTVKVVPATFGGGAANNAFTIKYPNVPLDVCSKFTTVGGNGFNLVVVNGTPVKDTSKTTGNVLDVAGTAAACNGGTGSVEIDFTSL